jgi:tetratricopeptide (TPR) repeat protein
MERRFTATPTAIAAACIFVVTQGCTTTTTMSEDQPHARLGTVAFPVECSAEAQRDFNVAMSYYHSFAFPDVAGAVDRVLLADPSCGMAHWARALALLDNPFTWPGNLTPAKMAQGPQMLSAARQAGLKTQRERDYVDALESFFRDHDKVDHRTRAKALEAAMEQVKNRYPQDTEAATLYALVLSANFDPADRQYTNQLKAAAILEPIFRQQPQHPGAAHYLIHSYDYPPIAHKGLDAARRYGAIAADAPHAQHMPSHIFTRTGAWKESIRSNQASVNTATDRTFDKWHAYDYMVYAHLQLGEDAAARRIVSEALGSPARIDHVGTAYAYAAMPARLALERAAWQTAANLPLTPSDGFPWAKYPMAESLNAYARGIGAAMSGNPTAARTEVTRLEKLRDVAASRKLGYWAGEIDVQAGVVRSLATCAEGNRSACLDGLRTAADREDGIEKHVVTPGRLVPAREVLAYTMLDAGDPAGALREFEKLLERDPNRLRAFSGAARAAQAAGDSKKAAEYAGKLVELTRSADTALEEVRRAKQLAGR